jgi:CBS domain-containing protein
MVGAGFRRFQGFPDDRTTHGPMRRAETSARLTETSTIEREVISVKARDIMTPKPFFVSPTDKVSKAAEIMRYEDIGGVPVCTHPSTPRLAGIITDRDIVVRWVARGHHADCLVSEVMTPVPLLSVQPDADISEIVGKMESGEVRRIPVVSDDGILIGIVAEADIATKLSPEVALPLRKRVQQYSAEPHIGLDIR